MPHLGKIGSTQDLRVIDSSDAAVTGGLSFWVDNASIVSVSPQGVLTYKSPGVVRVYVRSGAYRDSILMQSIRGFDVSPTGITGTGLAVAALNSQGWIAAWRSTPAENFLWRPTIGVTNLPCAPVDLNDKGQVLCNAWIWENGDTSRIAGAPGAAYKINEAGEIAGMAPGSKPYLWTPSGVTTYTTGAYRIAGMNEKGDITFVGFTGYPGMFIQKRNSSVVNIAGLYDPVYGGAFASDSGFVAGMDELGRSAPGARAAVWRPKGTGVERVIIGARLATAPSYQAIGAGGAALSVNDSGYVVGYVTGTTGYPFLWSSIVGGGPTPLSQLTTQSGWAFSSNTMRINNAGQIALVGSGTGVAQGIQLLTPKH
jgi:hypothetical protein